MNTKKIIAWILIGLTSALFLYSAQMYFLNTEMVKGYFTSLNFPAWVVIPLAIAKVLGVIAIVSNQSKWLKEWAFAGFFFDAVLATGAHYFNGDGLLGLSFYGIFLVLGARIMDRYRKAA